MAVPKPEREISMSVLGCPRCGKLWPMTTEHTDHERCRSCGGSLEPMSYEEGHRLATNFAYATDDLGRTSLPDRLA